jgi:hypothetical protein
MTEAVLSISIASLVVGVGTLVIAAFTLWNARRSMELAEDCMEYLREEQARLLVFLREERQTPKEESKQEREQYLEAQRRAERLSQEHLLPRQDQVRLAEELEQERAKYLEAQQRARQEREERERERRARRDAERKMDQLKRELQELREAQWARVDRRETSSPVSEALSEDRLGARGILKEKSLPTQKAQGTGRTPRPPARFPETTASKPAEGPSEGKKPGLGVWHPHPDDGANRGKVPAGQARPRSDAQVEMFRKHYDKYLENYQGYVELAERLYRKRENGEVPTGSREEREWEKSLRRVNDGIERTTARLDILEEHNPELATDDRISQRTSLARRHSELEVSEP